MIRIGLVGRFFGVFKLEKLSGLGQLPLDDGVLLEIWKVEVVDRINAFGELFELGRQIVDDLFVPYEASGRLSRFLEL